MEFDGFRITVVGLGLIGGSISMALKKLKVKELWGVDINEDVLKKAVDGGIIKRGFVNPEEPLKNSDLVIIALYPELTIKFIKENAHNFKAGAVVTDTAGIKRCIVTEAQKLLPGGIDFIGGHPMAGKEKEGFESADCSLLQGCSYILTPTERNRSESVIMLKGLLEQIGCSQVVTMSPERHDEIIAYTSHLPHILAVSLINSPMLDVEASSMLGGSFRDATRVAYINSMLWSELFLENSNNVIKQIEDMQNHMEVLKNCIKNKDREMIETILKSSRCKRKEMLHIENSQS